MPTLAFDPIAQPGIVATLVGFTAHNDVLALRRVSRAYRDAADAHIFSHVLLFELDGDVEVRDAQGRRLPGLQWEARDAAPPAERASLVTRLGHARVVDYYDDVNLEAADPELAAVLGNVHTARRRRGGHSLPVRHLVDTLQLGYTDVEDDGYDSDDDTPSARVTHVPDTVEDLTMCIRYDSGHHRLSESTYDIELTHVPPRITVVFAEEHFSVLPSRCWSRGSCWSSRSSRTSQLNSPHALPRWGFLRPLVRQLATYLPAAEPTVIAGLAQIPRILLGLPAAMPDDDVYRQFLDAILVHAPDAAAAADIEAAIVFCSLDEYRDDVGDKAFKLVTAAPGPVPSVALEEPAPSHEQDWPVDERMSKTQRHEWEKLVRTAARTLMRGCLLY